MRECVLYGLDESGAVVSTERFVGLPDAELTRISKERLKNYQVVEAWEGSVRLFTLGRRSPRDTTSGKASGSAES